MGLRSKQVPGDLEYWRQTLLPPHTAEELPKPPLIRRQQPLQQQAEPLNCPRCGSINTKFCYYNNYNKSQPRHFCKSCKRHWTKGGTLRNVPAGGGRKSKRPRISNTATTMAAVSTATSTATTATAPRQQDCPNQTSMSSIPYKALTGSVSSVSSPLLLNTTNGISISKPVKSFGLTNTTGSYASTPQNPNTEYPLLSTLSTTFDHKYTSLINPTSYKSLNDYSLNLDSMEESTITTLDIPNTSSTPWPGPDTISSMDMSNYWNWNEIDILTSSSDLNIAWDDVINP